MIYNVIAIIVTLLFSAFFSGMEIAFVSSNRLLAEVDDDNQGLRLRILRYFYRHPNNFVSTMLVGNNIALVLYGILFALIFDKYVFGPLGFDEAATVASDTICSTIVVLFTGEFLPKTIFKSAPNTLLSFFAVPAFVCYVTLYPVSRFATMLSKAMLLLFGVKMKHYDSASGFSRIDLDFLVQTTLENSENNPDNDEVQLFQNALEFADTKVRDCMVPRTEIVGVDINDCTTDELMAKFVESGCSKLIVYDADIDHIVGYIHSSEMFRNADNWKEHITKLQYVPETMSARKLMKSLLATKKSLAIVIDEFGGTCGLLSLEDILEEITGDIEDEHDNHKYVACQDSNGDYILSARLEIEKINEMFGLNLPESDEYMTLSGLILNEYQSFPKLNEVIDIAGMKCKIIKNTPTKIELVKLSKC